MNKNLDKTLTDVRIAFRLLAQFQSSILDIVRYIKDKTPYTDIWGKPRNFIDTNKPQFNYKQCEESYATLKVADSHPQNFLNGNNFEFYFGEKFINGKNVGMSIIQISDSGYFQTFNNSKSKYAGSYFPADQSNSYLVFTIGSEIWLGREASKQGSGEEEYYLFLQISFRSHKVLKL